MKKMPAWIVLMIICLCSGLLLAVINLLTADRIAEQKIISENATRAALFPEAKGFEELTLQESRFNVENLYSATDENGGVLGYIGQSNVKGYGGEIAVTTAVDLSGSIRGISVGGSSFAETPGLGALTKEAAFTDQFIGKKPDIVLNQDGVDTVAGASTSSRAVVSGVNAVANYIYTYELELLEESVSSYDGPVVSAAVQGFGGEITVNAGFAADNSLAYLSIDTPDETDGLGKLASEPSFTDQFIGKKGPFVYQQDGIEAIAGATITSNAVLNGLNSMVPGEGEENGTEVQAPGAVENPVNEAAFDGTVRFALAKGFGGEILVRAGFAGDQIAYLTIDTPDETPGLGKKASDDAFTGQFIGKTGPFVYAEDGIEAISGATVTSNAVLKALNSIISGSDGDNAGETEKADAASGATADAGTSATAAQPAETEKADAASGATADAGTSATAAQPAETEKADAASGATADAGTSATAAQPAETEKPDAATGATAEAGTSTAEEQPAETEQPDAASGATANE